MKRCASGESLRFALLALLTAWAAGAQAPAPTSAPRLDAVALLRQMAAEEATVQRLRVRYTEERLPGTVALGTIPDARLRRALQEEAAADRKRPQSKVGGELLADFDRAIIQRRWRPEGRPEAPGLIEVVTPTARMEAEDGRLQPGVIRLAKVTQPTWPPPEPRRWPVLGRVATWLLLDVDRGRLTAPRLTIEGAQQATVWFDTQAVGVMPAGRLAVTLRLQPQARVARLVREAKRTGSARLEITCRYDADNPTIIADEVAVTYRLSRDRGSGQVLKTERLKVAHVDVNPRLSPQEFTLQPPAGTHVKDDRFEQPLGYTQPRRPVTDEELFELAAQRGRPGRGRHLAWWQVVLVGAGVALLTLGVGRLRSGLAERRRV